MDPGARLGLGGGARACRLDSFFGFLVLPGLVDLIRFAVFEKNRALARHGETTEIGLPNPGFGLMRVANTPLLATRIRERDFCRSQAIFGKYGFLAPIPPYAGCQIPGWQPADTATGNLLSARIGGNYFREPRFSRSCSLTRLQPLQKKKSSREYPLE